MFHIHRGVGNNPMTGRGRHQVLLPIAIACAAIIAAAPDAAGQTLPASPSPNLPPGSDTLSSIVTAPFVRRDASDATDPDGSGIGPFTSSRQALLIGGLAISMAAYGYFILEFNNSRGDAGAAESAYEEDVRQNAQTYVDQGVELDQIQTFKDWQAAYEDAKASREWAARAGFLAIVIGFFAVLDAATSYDGPSPEASGLRFHPTLAVTPMQNNLVVGARVQF